MKMIFIDIDETLLFTTAQIHVVKNGSVIRKLSNQQYNSYELQEGESFDFCEFADSSLLVRTSVLNHVMVERLLQHRYNGDEVVLLTARSDFDCKQTIIEYFNYLGIAVGHYKDSLIHIARTGQEKYAAYGKSHTRKRHVIEKLLAKRPDVNYIAMYDDHDENLSEFKKIDMRSDAYKVTHSEIAVA